MNFSSTRLFHVSENPNIEIFEPRPAPSPDSGVQGLAVWAVDEVHLPNYLLPRDCPRVTFAINEKTSECDQKKFHFEKTTNRVVAVESNWFSKIQSTTLFLYEFPEKQFECIDAGAGYFISRTSVTPKAITKMQNLIPELLCRSVEVRFLPQLWDLRDSVINSSMEFSIIRFRHAKPRSNRST